MPRDVHKLAAAAVLQGQESEDAAMLAHCREQAMRPTPEAGSFATAFALLRLTDMARRLIVSDLRDEAAEAGR
ncbi:hypothetical protein [Rhodovastum atsumiense]|uniref:Uncharacterized protein n=1 Tax=Rhodovastum atsumiense TaxID=504468 RepID=A0A5M6IUJ2_9PROT|nr:hypothetical protein [Rhodovastum atsumiense]KAA5611619.1 hypothetical protein F1189_13740 [Rhodovastum atsumiense]